MDNGLVRNRGGSEVPGSYGWDLGVAEKSEVERHLEMESVELVKN